MCSLQNGWHTTTAYTYRPPNLIPGYTGYIPEQHYGYGDTFGTITANQFHKQRNLCLSSSVYEKHKEQLPPAFPTVYSNNPALVLANRRRSRERWLAIQKYQRSGEGAKEEKLQTFLQSCQAHRQHYSDMTGTIERVDEFLLPKLTAPRIDKGKIRNKTSKKPRQKREAQVSIAKKRGNSRQRAIRDQFFENR